MVLNCSPSVCRWHCGRGRLALVKRGLRATAFGGRGLTRVSPRHPFHHAFDGKEGLDRAFPPTRFSKEASLGTMVVPCFGPARAFVIRARHGGASSRKSRNQPHRSLLFSSLV
jgi:hypothetical protein